MHSTQTLCQQYQDTSLATAVALASKQQQTQTWLEEAGVELELLVAQPLQTQAELVATESIRSVGVELELHWLRYLV